MSTFYGGEQFVQLAKVTGTVSRNNSQVGLIYTIPTGFYGKIKFAYVGYDFNDSQYYGNATPANVWLSPPEAGTAFGGTYFNSRITITDSNQTYNLQKQLYAPRGTFYDTYCQEGSNFTIVGETGSQTVYRYELDIELYKIP